MVHDRSGTDARVVTDLRSVEDQHRRGQVAVRADLAAGEYAGGPDERPPADRDGKGGPTRAADRPENRVRQDDRLVAKRDRRTAAFDHDAMVDLAPLADRH